MPSRPLGHYGFAPGPILRSLSEYNEQALVPERMYAVKGARVVCANYELILHDFAEQLAGAIARDGKQTLDEEQRRAIDEWLVSNAAFISEAQAAQTITNTPISVTSREREVYRPPRYGRAAVIPVAYSMAGTPVALMDVKGVGVPPGTVPTVSPIHENHSSGLQDLSGAIHEILFAELANSIFQHTGSRYGVVPNYAVLDPGFDIKDAFGRQERAALLVRRAHTRPAILWGDEDPGPGVARVQLDILFQLRRFGMDSTTSFKLTVRSGGLRVRWVNASLLFEPQELDRIRSLTRFNSSPLWLDAANIAFTSQMKDIPPRPQLFDFGGFKLRNRFTNPLFASTIADYCRLIGEFVQPDDQRFTQPLPQSHIPLQANEMAIILAWKYRLGAMNGDQIRDALNHFIDYATSRFAGGIT